ncbi:g6827 [Coccomyxa elongata]
MKRSKGPDLLPHPADHARLTKTISDVKTLLSDIEIGPHIGAGTFGQVYKGRWKGTSVAVKVIGHQGAGYKSNSQTSREAMIGLASAHPNVVAVYRVITAENEIIAAEIWAKDGFNLKTYIVMEYCDKGTLEQHRKAGWALLQTDYQRGLVWVLRCLLEIVFGMEYLHSLSIVHGDLKCANVLCKSSTSDARGFTCKVADFGLSKTVATDGVSAITSKPGTAVFAAPELLRAGSLAAESDVYSFGVVAWHLISMGSGLADMEDVQVHYQVLEKNWRPAFPKETPQQYRDVVSTCWATEKKDRPSFHKVRLTLTKMLAEEVAARSQILRSQRSQSGDVDVRTALKDIIAVDPRSLTG